MFSNGPNGLLPPSRKVEFNYLNLEIEELVKLVRSKPKNKL